MRNDRRTVLRSEVAGAAWALLEKRRCDVVEMLRSCGVSPGVVPADTEVRREGSRVVLERFVYDSAMDNRVMRENDGSLKIEEFFVEPDRVPDWIPSG